MPDPSEKQEHDLIDRIMDLASKSDAEALFAGLQAALIGVNDIQHGRHGALGGPWEAYSRVLRALEDGGPYGSPKQLAAAARREAERKAAE